MKKLDRNCPAFIPFSVFVGYGYLSAIPRTIIDGYSHEYQVTSTFVLQMLLYY